MIVDTTPELERTISFYQSKYPTAGLGVYTKADWARLHTAYQLGVGRSVLDIGVANGALLHMFDQSDRTDRVMGIDIRRHEQLILPDKAEFDVMSVVDLKFADNEFDSVVCMEVLEHLESPDLAKALPELRRVAGTRLILTVPYNEPLPLWWHDKPGGHRQQFSAARLHEMFPDAWALMQPRPGAGVDWIFLVETKETPVRGMVPLADLVARPAGMAVPATYVATDVEAEPTTVDAPDAPRPQPQPQPLPLPVRSDDHSFEVYYRLAGSREQQQVVRQRVGWLVSQAQGERVLEVGCSQGITSLLLGREGAHVVGIDTRADAIAFARQQLRFEADAVQERVRFDEAELSDVSGGPFDTIVVGEALLRHSQPQRLLEQVKDLLTADGRVVFSVPVGVSQDAGQLQHLYVASLRELVSHVFNVTELTTDVGFMRCIAGRSDDESVAPWQQLLTVSDDAFAYVDGVHAAELEAMRQRIEIAESAATDASHALRQLEAKAKMREQRLQQKVDMFRAGHERAIGLAERLHHKEWMIRHKDQSIQEKARVIKDQDRDLDRLRGRVATRIGRGVLALLGARDETAPTIAKQSLHSTPAVASYQPSPLLHNVAGAPLNLTVACILDEFSWENLRHEMDLYQLPKDWWQAIEARPPAFLLVESAWAGNNGQWRDAVTYTEPKPHNPLFALLEYCRDKQIPTVFWNKEDPPNYDRFIDAAARFDYVFTSDVNCVDRYAKDAPNCTVSVLPFAAQPATQNPVNRLRFPALGDVCFAGAWYPRHPERHQDARMLLHASMKHDLVIYDRYANHPQSDKYRYPEEFQPYIKGSLAFEEMVEKYRQFGVFLNVNSVKDSPTMFSRRVLELLACGTPVVSGYAEGIEALLGDTVPMVTTEAAATELIDRIMAEPLYRDELVLKGQRKIFAEHTYRKRVEHICEVVGLEVAPTRHKVTAITATIRKAFVDDMLDNFKRQSYQDRELLVVINAGAELTEEYVVERATAKGVTDYRVIVADEGVPLGTCLNMAVEQASGDIFAKMDDDDYYGEHYLQDSVQALMYSGADCVGKQSYFTYGEGPDKLYLRTPGHQHRMTEFVIGTTLVAHKHIFPQVSFGDTRVGEDSIFLERLKTAGKQLYSHSRYNYIKFYAKSLDHHTWKVSEDEYLGKAEEFAAGYAVDKVCF